MGHLRSHPIGRKPQWLDEQAAETLYLSSVTISEQLFGIGALPAGKRKDRLTEALEPTASCLSMSLPQNAMPTSR